MKKANHNPQEATPATIQESRGSPLEFSRVLLLMSKRVQRGSLAAIVREDILACRDRFSCVPTLARYAACISPEQEQEAAEELAHQLMVAAQSNLVAVTSSLAASYPLWRTKLESACLAATLLETTQGNRTLPEFVGPMCPDGLPRYCVGEILSTGTFGIVTSGIDRLLDDGRQAANVAIKFIRATPANPTPWQAEAIRGAVVVHPCGIRALDFGSIDERDGYVVFERVDGDSLLSNAVAEKRASAMTVAARGAELATALAEMHAAGIVHGDISPANVLLDRFGRLRLVDYGISQPATPAAIENDVCRMAELIQWMILGYVPPIESVGRKPAFGLERTLVLLARSVRSRPGSALQFSAALTASAVRAQRVRIWAAIILFAIFHIFAVIVMAR